MSDLVAGLKPDFIVGLDLGQSRDFTALTVLERSWHRSPEDPQKVVSHYSLRHLKRWQLKTGYPQIVQEVGDLVQTPPLNRPLLAVDQTGVGVAIVDMFRQARVQAGLNAIVITGGHEVTREDAWHVPKKELVSTVQLLLQTGRIKFARLPETDLLVKELLSFKVKITINANETFEAWRERDHDDMVLAVALAAWLAEEVGSPAYSTAQWSGDPSPRRRLYGRDDPAGSFRIV